MSSASFAALQLLLMRATETQHDWNLKKTLANYEQLSDNSNSPRGQNFKRG